MLRFSEKSELERVFSLPQSASLTAPSSEGALVPSSDEGGGKTVGFDGGRDLERTFSM